MNVSTKSLSLPVQILLIKPIIKKLSYAHFPSYDLFLYNIINKYSRKLFQPIRIKTNKNTNKRLKFFEVKMQIHKRLLGLNASIQTIDKHIQVLFIQVYHGKM